MTEKQYAPGPLGRARPIKQRVGMGAIRGMWTFVFGAVGYVVVYLSDLANVVNLGEWTVPVSLAIAGACYSLKKTFWPDTTF